MTTAIGIAGVRRFRPAAVGTLAALITALSVVVPVLVPALSSPAAAGALALDSTSHTVWLCRPGQASDPCAGPRTATSVTATGAQSSFSTTPSPRAAKFDCFYVYPTVSTESSLNADLAVQSQETDIAEGQVAQFSSVCNIWAPMYRQATGVALDDGEAYTSAVIDTAYESLLSGWKDYLAHDNHGRPVIFIGDSQGAALLIKLLRTQVDPSPQLRKRLVSAILLGGNVQVPTGRDVGASFRHIPTCASPRQTGCVIAYSSFPSEPGSDAVVGRAGQGVSVVTAQPTVGQQVACVNPVTFSSSTGDLVSMYPTSVEGVLGVTTPWTAYPDLYSARCMHDGTASWLQVERTDSSPSDTRPSIPSEGPQWGYHIYDVNLALGNLVLDAAYEEAGFH
jgi:hypothetical protein